MSWKQKLALIINLIISDLLRFILGPCGVAQVI